MKKQNEKTQMINFILVRSFPEVIYHNSDHEGLQNLLFFADYLFPHFVESLFGQVGIRTPFKPRDFEVMYSVEEDYLSVRIEIKNHRYTDIRRVYILFQVPNDANGPIRNSSYYIVEDDNGQTNCLHINEDFKLEICCKNISEQEDEQNIIEKDYLIRLKSGILK